MARLTSLFALLAAFSIARADDVPVSATASAKLTVTGMRCGEGCPPKVKAAIEGQGGADVDVSYPESRATFRFDPARTDLAEVRRVLLEEGYEIALAEPIAVVWEKDGVRIEATTSAPSVGVEGSAQVQVRVSAPGHALSALTVRTTGPANVEGLAADGKRIAGPTGSAEVEETFRVTKRSRARFLEFRIAVSAEGLPETTLPALVQFDR